MKILRTVDAHFRTSADGAVYVDTWPNTPLVAQFTYTPHLSGYTFIKADATQLQSYNLSLKKKYGKENDLRLYPAYLKGKDDVSMESRIVEFHSGVYLVIMNNNDTRKVKIDRGFDFGVFTVPYDVYTPGLTTPIKEGPDWKAYVVYDDMYLVSNLSARLE